MSTRGIEPVGEGRKTHEPHRTALCKLSLFLIFGFLSSPGYSKIQGSGAPPGSEITQHARSIQPGEVVRLTLDSSRPLRQVEGIIFERTFPFYRGENSHLWHGLIGIDLGTRAGQYSIRINMVGMDGKRISLEHKLPVRAKSFPTRRLSVDEKYVNPPEKELRRIRRESRILRKLFAGRSPRRLWEESFVLPVPGPSTSSFGKRSILNGRPRSPHSGTDFDAEAGTPIKAPNSGKVVLAANLYFSGNTVIIDHGLGLFSYLAHLSRFAVKKGDQVRRGEIVGQVGATGRVTGPHLHWSLRLVRTRVDPLSLIAALRKIPQNTPPE